MNSPTNQAIIHWNVRGLISKSHEFKKTFADISPLIASIQETHFRDNDHYNFSIPGYSLLTNNINASFRRGGVALYISDALIHRELQIKTPLNAVAAEVMFNNRIIIVVSLYIPPYRDHFDAAQLRTLLTHLLRKGPLLLVGDLNAHHPLWGSETTSSRGSEVETIFSDLDLICLNDGSPTFLSASSQTFSSIDLASCSPEIASWFQFCADDNNHFSDHYPIRLFTTFTQWLLPPPRVPAWALTRADWGLFSESVREGTEEMTSSEITEILDIILKAAETSIPITKPHRRKASTPWWTPECAHAVAKRKRALRVYQKYISPASHQNYLIANRHCRAVLRRAKNASWRSFISSFNRSTPLSHIWRIVKAFSNKRDPVGAFPQLKMDDVCYSDPNDVVNIFADYYSKVSSPDNYTTERHSFFESTLATVNFSPGSSEDYNHPITLQELSAAIVNSGKTSVGPDGIHYDFFRHLSVSSLKVLLRCFNEAWMTGSFPEEWLKSFVIPILKPSKPRTDPASYRPIYLTSCACKLLEKIVNNRLRYFLESSGSLDPFQSGFRKGRCTADNIIRLTNTIQRGFRKRHHTVAVFLDLSAAYDRVHPSALLHFVNKLGIRGNLAAFIKNFLQPRTFQVRIQTFMSPPTEKRYGVPQGSVIAPTLFLIMINEIAQKIEKTPPYVLHSIFADDVALWCCHLSIDTAARRIQRALNVISRWCVDWGLNISVPKSTCVVFTRCRRPLPRLLQPLSIHSELIPEFSAHTFLGITLDSKLSLQLHANRSKIKGQKRLNILRAVSSTKWGGDRKTLTLLYNSVIRSVLEYNSWLYVHLAQSHQDSLEVVQNSALRLITGACKSTPISSLLTETNVIPLALRSHQALFKYYFKVKSCRNHPAGICFVNKKSDLISKSFGRSPPVGVKLHSLCKRYGIQISTIEIEQRPTLLPMWVYPPPDVKLLYSDLKKDILQAEVLQTFNKFKEQHSDFTFIYTDGSKGERGVGAAFFGPVEKAFCLPKHKSVFSAELFAILQALKHVQLEGIEKAVICTDSLSSLRAIEHLNYGSRLVFQTLETLNRLSNTKIIFLWIPGHAGISGNEEADKLAKQGADSGEVISLPFTPQEAACLTSSALSAYAQQQWNTSSTGRHTFEIKPLLQIWTSSFQQNRRSEVILARLRMGHTFMTHQHIFLAGRERNVCSVCNVPITISHLLIFCPKYHQSRLPLVEYAAENHTTLSLPFLLGDDHPSLIKLLFSFLEDSCLSYEI